MATRPVRVAGTEIDLEANGALLADGGIVELDDDTITTSDVAGLFTMTLEVDAAGTFSAAPTTGNGLHIYEQKINSDGNDAPDIESDFQFDHLHTFEFNDADEAQYLRVEGIPVNLTGGKYWAEWEDGGAGSASISAGWKVRAIIEDVQSQLVQ